MAEPIGLQFTPESPPLEGVTTEFLYRELLKAQSAIALLIEGHHIVRTSAPKKPREGMTVEADGVLWKPGSGPGLYTYINGAWVAATREVGWRDMLGAIYVQDTGSANAPSWSTYRGNLKAWEMPKAAGASMREVFTVLHLDHDYKVGSDIYVHVHWSQIIVDTGNAGAPGNVKWYFDVSYAKGHQQQAFSAPITTSVVQTCSGTQYQHMIAEVQLSASSPTGSQLDSDDLEVDGLIMIRCYRDRSDVADTANESVFVHFVDVHYQTDRVATPQKAPNFYTP